MNEAGVVIGIDVGWSEKKKTTGVCLIEWGTDSISIDCTRVGTEDAAFEGSLRKRIGDNRFVAVAIDGPLCPTFSEIGEYRDAELMLTRGFQSRIGKPGQSSSPNGRKLNQAANHYATLLKNSQLVSEATHIARIDANAIVEAFPTSFLGVMLSNGQYPTAGARSDIYFDHLLGPDSKEPRRPDVNQLQQLVIRLLPNRRLTTDLSKVIHHEDKASVVCAMTALAVAARRYVAVGNARQGYIVLPPRADQSGVGLQPWAWELLTHNCPQDGGSKIIVEPEVDDS